MTVAPGGRLGPYEILASLGAGGMGEVFRARDPRLGREVAIKVLPKEMASHPDRLARFEREAKTVAALNHPNIVVIYSIEESDGVRFLTMELVEGRSLDASVNPGGLPVPRVLDLAIPLADALAAAHDRGVVHRDLKPANVMVSREGRVKVLDFGLAKPSLDAPPEASQAATMEVPISRVGQVMGTVPYMAPEQLRGEAVDGRTDLFSLGILLYELVTGSRPFGGATSADVTSAILRDRPAPLESVRADLPHDLKRIIARCLEKDPERRVQTAKDVRNELEFLRRALQEGDAFDLSRSFPASGPFPTAAGSSTGLTSSPGVRPDTLRASLSPSPAPSSANHLTPAAPSSPTGSTASEARAPATQAPSNHAPACDAGSSAPSIAVLPFANRSRDEEDEYFADGLADELLGVLAKIRGLRVAARSSSFTFKGKEATVAEVGRALGVETVLEGSVRKAGSRVRISVQLVKVADGYHLWAETYDRTLEDIFAVQDDIAQSVVKELRRTLLGQDPDSKTSGETRAEVAAAAKGRGESGEAHRLFLQGRFHVGRLGRHDITKGIEYLRQALEIDPGHALAWAWLSRAYWNEAGYGWAPVNEGCTRAREAALRALELEPDLVEGHLALGTVRMSYEWDWRSADASFRRALELAPGNAQVLRAAGTLARDLGRVEEGLELCRRAVEQDPLSASCYNALCMCYRAAGLYADAERASRRALEISPQHVATRMVLSLVVLAQGRIEEALQEAERESEEWARLSALAVIHHAAGRPDESERALRGVVERWAGDAALQIAGVHSMRGEIEQAFAWLERAYAQKDAGLAGIKPEPYFEPLHGDPRWGAFLAKMGLAD